jgi:hypothetical protein
MRYMRIQFRCRDSLLLQASLGETSVQPRLSELRAQANRQRVEPVCSSGCRLFFCVVTTQKNQGVPSRRPTHVSVRPTIRYGRPIVKKRTSDQ